MIGVMPAGPALLVEVEDAVHVAVVGDPDRRLAVGRGRGDDIVTRAAPSSIENSVCRCRWVKESPTVLAPPAVGPDKTVSPRELHGGDS